VSSGNGVEWMGEKRLLGVTNGLEVWDFEVIEKMGYVNHRTDAFHTVCTVGSRVDLQTRELLLTSRFTGLEAEIKVSGCRLVRE